MSATSECPTLASLVSLPYIDADGQLPQQFEGKIGVYAIYSGTPELLYIGYSRDVALSLKQHLVRQPLDCDSVKVFTVERPNRTLLAEIKDAWIGENGQVPVGNGPQATLWEEPIDVKAHMLPEELTQYADPQLEERQHLSVLKNAARRIEQEILDVLAQRGVQEAIRFNPKLKEQGLLDLK